MNDELTPTVLAELRGLLEAKRSSLQADIRALNRADDIETEFDTRVDVVGDSADSSVDLQGIDDNRSDADGLQHDLAEVEHALAKFDTGAYGQCEACDGPIPLARLRILPEARYDVQHQAEVDALQKR